MNLPPKWWIKVNIYGTAKGAPVRAGTLVEFFKIIGDFQKEVSQHSLETGFAFEVELHGFMIAVEMAHKFKWIPLCIETYSIYVVLLFKNNLYKVSWRFRIDKAQELFDMPRSITLGSHIFLGKEIV